MRRSFIAVLAFVPLVIAACGTDNTAAPSAPSGVPRVNSAPTNSAPTVTLAPQGAASCNPVGTQYGCSVTLKALASDADGDPLTYSWSGTTSGFSQTGYCQSSPSSPDMGICRISSPEQVVVGSVVVRDDHGHATTAELQVVGEGVNHAPRVRLTVGPFALPGGSPTLEMFGIIEDPDEGQLCLGIYVVSGSASGDCKPAVAFWSSCLEGGPTVDIYRTAPTGTCEVTLKVRDSANLVGTTVTTIRY
jgi:hypothetical protein